jgi:hypothetical protein
MCVSTGVVQRHTVACSCLDFLFAMDETLLFNTASNAQRRALLPLNLCRQACILHAGSILLIAGLT